jgi:hypothetical protein
VGSLALITLLTGGCAARRHTVVGPAYTPEALDRLAADAEAQCRAHRAGDPASPPNPFTTDGCSLWPDGQWQACCVTHDVSYWCGGSAVDRKHADQRLRACVVETGHPVNAGFMYWGVRLGGHPWLPFPWRWGYGWDWPHGYADTDP